MMKTVDEVNSDKTKVPDEFILSKTFCLIVLLTYFDEQTDSQLR